jgi:hypothetical protein
MSNITSMASLHKTFDKKIKWHFQHCDHLNGDVQPNVITYGFDQLNGFPQSDF